MFYFATFGLIEIYMKFIGTISVFDYVCACACAC